MALQEIDEVLLEYYRQGFYPMTLTDDFSHGNVLAVLRKAQVIYNEVAQTPCRGLKVFKLSRNGGPSQYCHHPLCPTCWHRALRNMYQAFKRLPEKRYYYVRTTDEEKWTQEPHVRCMKRFLGNGTRSTLLGYLLSCAACGPQITPEIIGYDPFQGELYYSFVGLFTSEYPLPVWEQGAGVLEDPRDHYSKIVGMVYQDAYVDRDTAIDAWLSQLGHPARYIEHPIYSLYLRAFKARKQRCRRLNNKIIDRL